MSLIRKHVAVLQAWACLALVYLKSVMLDHFIAKNATAHKVNSCYTLAICYCTFCVGKHTILGPAAESPYGEPRAFELTIGTPVTSSFGQSLHQFWFL